GSVHNIMQIGLAAINTMLNAEGSSVDLGNLMLLVTAVYFAIVVFLIVMTTVWPTLSIALTKSNVAQQMKRIGMRTIAMSSVVLNPLMHKKVLVSIVDLIRAYEAFLVAHPEADAGEDLNRRDRDVSVSMMTNVLPQDGANDMDADCSPQGGRGGTIGEGLLGPLPGVPHSVTPTGQNGKFLNTSDYNSTAYVPDSKRSKSPHSILEAVLDVVTGHDAADPEEELQDGEFDT
ncbi:membrane-associated protein, putative, partial [Bodo saltans]